MTNCKLKRSKKKIKTRFTVEFNLDDEDTALSIANYLSNTWNWESDLKDIILGE